MSHDRQPVIRRDITDVDRDASILDVVADRTTFDRGLGDHGKRVERVAYKPGCPCCGTDELIRVKDINTDLPDQFSYWCLNPSCRYFVHDELESLIEPHASVMPDRPKVWQQTHECLLCEQRSHTAISESEFNAKRQNGLVEDGIVKFRCDECLSNGRNRDEQNA